MTEQEELDGLKHKLWALRDQVRGDTLNMLRWLKEAGDASKLVPPYMPVVTERIERVITLLESRL